MAKGGELGCSDIPGWDGSEDMLPTASGIELDGTDQSKNPLTKQPHGAVHVAERSVSDNDGTDEHLQPRVTLSQIAKYRTGKTPEHADIETLQQAAEIAGKVVLLKRGGCGFLEKVMWAQKRGGVALIVGDDQRGGALVRMYARGDTSNVTIPALFTSHTTAHLLSSLLPSGGFSHGSLSKDIANDQKSADNNLSSSPLEAGWFRTLLSGLGFKVSSSASSKDAISRPPNSGEVDGSAREDASQESTKTGTALLVATNAPADFVIGKQDWRDPGLLASASPSDIVTKPTSTPKDRQKGGSVTPSSGEYADLHRDGSNEVVKDHANNNRESLIPARVRDSHKASSTDKQTKGAHPSGPHEGLWVTLTPTNMSTSPFFDTLLVLVVSPLVTLTVVYALLLLRSRIRRRRWRAPKSLVERLPVRTYHTISDSSPSATPSASSPSTPLLQHESPQPTSSQARSQPQTTPEAPATSSTFRLGHRTPEEEKRESGLAAWRRKYGGRQKECVVCLEEYEDGVSQVMSLPCGHEFHADCM